MDISFRSTRIASKSFEVPLFMDSSQNDALDEILDNFENSIGQKEGDFDSSFLFDVFSDTKIAKGLYFILTKYFYDLKGLESYDILSYELRSKLFELMEQSNLSWASYRQQKQLLSDLSKSEGLSSLQVEDRLFADFSENFKVIRRGKERPKVELVINYYNTEILKFLFNKSYSVYFSISNYKTKGYFVKNLIRNCKFLGIDYDLEVIKDTEDENELLVSLLGPNELVGRNVKYSNNLYSLIIRNFNDLQQEIKQIFLEIQYFETKKQIFLPLENFPRIIDDTQQEILFDSNIEKIFSEQWTMNFPHWTITREPLIIEHNLVMIPDFLLTYRNQSFYFEIVGFWTERYLTKKIKKVILLRNKYPNMILLVDKSLDWPETSVPTFFYDKKVPVLEIGMFLKQFEDRELEVLLKNTNFDKIKIAIEERLQDEHLLYEDDLFTIFKVAYSFELKKLFEYYFTYFNKRCGFVYFSNYSFITSTNFLFELKKYLVTTSINKALNIQKLINQFSFMNEKYLKILLTYLGYDFKYKSLLEEELVYKKDKVIISEIV